MFAKLLKYEWKSSAGLLGILSACALGVGCVAAVVLRLLTTYWDQIMEREELSLVLIPAFLFLFFAYIGLFLYAASAQFILLFRFYKSRFTDEGYLTFTLPVKTSHIFLSSAVNIVIWDVIVGIVVVAALAIAVVLGPVWSDSALRELHMVFQEMRYVFSDTFLSDVTPGYLVSLPILAAYSLIYPMTAVVLGASAAKKHKVLAIIGIMIAISVGYSTINSLISGIMQMLMVVNENNIGLIMTLTPYVTSILPLALTVVGYCLSIHLMKKRLNLP